MFLKSSPYRNQPVPGMFTGTLYAGRVMESVLIVAPDLERAPLAAMLKDAGLVTFEAREGPDGVRQILDKGPTVIVMADDLPPIDGTDCLAFVRRLTVAPIMVVGAGGEGRVGYLLVLGADVYVTCPIDGPHFLARLRTLLRRERAGSHLDPNQDLDPRHRLDAAGGLSDLTPIEARLLRCLLDKNGGIASREELSEVVWGEPRKGSSLRFYILRLRRKLALGAFGEILTLRGRGYRLLLNEPGAVSA